MKLIKTLKSYALYTLLVAGGFTACTVDSSRVQKDTVENEFGAGITILTIDECEYVWVKRGYGGGLTHKGNCKNPEHACN
jgi:hypothetical protein